MAKAVKNDVPSKAKHVGIKMIVDNAVRTAYKFCASKFSPIFFLSNDQSFGGDDHSVKRPFGEIVFSITVLNYMAGRGNGHSAICLSVN